MLRSGSAVVATFVAALAASAAMAGPEWIESFIGNAGNTPPDAQPTPGSGPLAKINGGLDLGFAGQSSDFEDMFIINIANPSEFSATTVGPNGATAFDSQLWLFTIDGRAVLGNNDTLPDPANAMRCRADLVKDGVINCNDILAVINAWGPCNCCNADADCDGQANVNDLLHVINNWGVVNGGCEVEGSTLGSISTDGTKHTIPGPGLYLLAVSSAGTVPAGANGPMFAFGCSPGEVSGPDGPGGEDVLTHWEFVDCQATALGDYSIYVGGGSAVQMSGLFLDIKPDGCPNSHNVESTGVLPVAIPGTGGFDPLLVDASTIVIARTDGVGGEVPLVDGSAQLEDTATPVPGSCQCSSEGAAFGKGCDDEDSENEDCIVDLNVKFSSPEMRVVLLLDDVPGDTLLELEVRGQLLNGTPFAARDCIRIVPPTDDDGGDSSK